MPDHLRQFVVGGRGGLAGPESVRRILGHRRRSNWWLGYRWRRRACSGVRDDPVHDRAEAALVRRRQIAHRQLIDIGLAVVGQHRGQLRKVGIVFDQAVPGLLIVGRLGGDRYGSDRSGKGRPIKTRAGQVCRLSHFRCGCKRRLPANDRLFGSRSRYCTQWHFEALGAGRTRYAPSILLGHLQRHQADAHQQKSERGPSHRNAQQKANEQQNPASNPHSTSPSPSQLLADFGLGR